MPIPFTCPYCGVQTPVDERYAGQSGPCFQCGRTVIVPAGPGAYATPAGSGSSAAVVIVVVLVVLGLLALLFCGGFMAFFWSARGMARRMPPPMPITEDFKDLPADFPEQQAADFPEEFYDSPAPDRFTRVHLVPSDGELPALFRAHAAKAKAAGRRPFVELGRTSSPDCMRLYCSFQDRRVIDAFSGTYIIHLDLDQWGDAPVKAALEASGVPAFFEIDDRGRPTGRSIEIAVDGVDPPREIARALKPFFQDRSQ